MCRVNSYKANYRHSTAQSQNSFQLQCSNNNDDNNNRPKQSSTSLTDLIIIQFSSILVYNKQIPMPKSLVHSPPSSVRNETPQERWWKKLQTRSYSRHKQAPLYSTNISNESTKIQNNAAHVTAYKYTRDKTNDCEILITLGEDNKKSARKLMSLHGHLLCGREVYKAESKARLKHCDL
jgi:hypothetical protein